MTSDPDTSDDRDNAERRAAPDGFSINPVVLGVSIAVATFALDLSLPLGVAAGVPYVALVLTGIWFQKSSHIYILAAIGTVLTIVGYVVSPGGGVPWVVLFNRGLALFAIWITAFLLASRKRYENALRLSRDNLEVRVAKRTSELSEKITELDFQKFALDEHAIVSITDIGGNITYANEKFCDISGYSIDELIGQNHRIVKSDGHSKEFYTELWKTISRGKVWQGEIKNKKKNGGHYWVMSTIVPTLNDKGKPFLYVSIRTDITQRKEAEVVAMTASRAKSDLLANMSHELRTPLNAIIGFSQVLMEGTFGKLVNDKQNEYVNDIHSSGHHLLELINDILDVSAIEAGALELHEENVSISNVVDASMRLIRERAYGGQVSLTASIAPALPQIYADERRVKQVLLNLLNNAVKFTPGGGEVTICSRLSDNGSMSVTVSDTGIGMDEEEAKVAMSTFGQVDSGLDRRHEGTGLGLPLTKGIMELHGGTLEVNSEKGKGTTITATFPKQRVIQD